MKSKSLWFLHQKEVGFREEELDTTRGNEILVETLYSGISHGTERLIYRGEVAEGLQLNSLIKTIKGQFPFPVKYGYSNVGKVVDTGEKVSGLQKGDVIFAFNPHETKYVIPEKEAVKLPADISPLHGVFIPGVETAPKVQQTSKPSCFCSSYTSLTFIPILLLVSSPYGFSHLHL